MKINKLKYLSKLLLKNKKYKKWRGYLEKETYSSAK
jgi:hypothetical protein